jgi:hypothetical protein
MSRIRFATARDVIDSFTVAPGTITEPATDAGPLDFLRVLVSKGKLDEAVTFCGYLLPRREAVWWACRSVRALGAEAGNVNLEGLRLAEAWVQDPSAERRKAAEDFANAADKNNPLTWLASAAAWSGGAITMGRGPAIAPPPELTPHAARIAILLSARGLRPDEFRTKLAACVEDGAKLAESGL